LGHVETRVPCAVLDREGRILAERHPRDPRRAEVVHGEALGAVVIGEEFRTRDARRAEAPLEPIGNLLQLQGEDASIAARLFVEGAEEREHVRLDPELTRATSLRPLLSLAPSIPPATDDDDPVLQVHILPAQPPELGPPRVEVDGQAVPAAPVKRNLLAGDELQELPRVEERLATLVPPLGGQDVGGGVGLPHA
jgi:hypothetical protein